MIEVLQVSVDLPSMALGGLLTASAIFIILVFFYD